MQEHKLINYMLSIVHNPPSSPLFLKGGGVNFNYLSDGGNLKVKNLKKGWKHGVQGQVFLKGGGGLALSLFHFIKVSHFYI